MQGYRTAAWAEYRQKVIRLDGGVCSACGRGPKDGAALHVHHKQYLPGHKPWEYPFDLCEALCSGCHAAEHGIVAPRTGWDFAGVDDLGDLVGSCELCNTPIRYVFMVTHPDWRPMEVGTDCCDHLTSTGTASEYIETKKKLAEKRKRFVSSRRWVPAPRGACRIVQKRLEVLIVPDSEGFRLKIEGVKGKKLFRELFDAKLFAFDFIESGEAEQFLQKHREKWLRNFLGGRR